MMHGSRTIRADEIVTCFRKRTALVRGLHGVAAAGFDEQALLRYLSERIRWEQGMPAAVGSGRASVLHKLRALCHSCRLQCSSWSHLAYAVNSTFSFVGDLGVESLLTKVRCRVDDLFGPWAVDPPETLGEDAQLDLHAIAEPSAPVINLNRAVFVAGVLHIVHQATEELGNVLVYWKTWIEDLTTVTRLLSRKWTRQRLIATCFSEGPQVVFSNVRFDLGVRLI